MEVYELLKKDHKEVKALFEKLAKTNESQVDQREKLFEELKLLLSIHAEAEEKFFYSISSKEDESRETTLEAIEEHKVMKRLLKELDMNQKGTEEWAAKLKVLQENTEHHVEEEENELFEECKKVLSSDEAEEIGSEIEEFKEEQLFTKK